MRRGELIGELRRVCEQQQDSFSMLGHILSGHSSARWVAYANSGGYGGRARLGLNMYYPKPSDTQALLDALYGEGVIVVKDRALFYKGRQLTKVPSEKEPCVTIPTPDKIGGVWQEGDTA